MEKQFISKTLTESGMSIDGFRIQSTPSSTDIHWHSCAEIIHQRRGDAIVFVGERWERLGAGDTVFMPAGHLHCCECVDPKAERVVIGLDEGAAFSADLLHDTPSALALREGGGDALIFRGGTIARLLSHACELSKNPTPCERVDCAILVHEVYREFLFRWQERGYLVGCGATSSLSRSVERIIAKQFREPLLASDVCRRLNMSYSHMASRLRAERGVSFEGLLLSYRIEQSKRLLLTTEKSITEIALEVGFTDSSYFIKKFRQVEKITPYKYKRMHLKKGQIG